MGHLVTIRGGAMCNWERELLEDQKYNSSRESEKQLLPKYEHLTHFATWEDLREWVETNSKFLVTLDLEEIQKAKDAEMKEAMDKLNREFESLQGCSEKE